MCWHFSLPRLLLNCLLGGSCRRTHLPRLKLSRHQTMLAKRHDRCASPGCTPRRPDARRSRRRSWSKTRIRAVFASFSRRSSCRVRRCFFRNCAVLWQFCLVSFVGWAQDTRGLVSTSFYFLCDLGAWFSSNGCPSICRRNQIEKSSTCFNDIQK